MAKKDAVKGVGEYLGELCRYCKADLGYPSVSIVSNGSRITEEWFQKYCKRK
jgi:radical S-adenosyl methionine domain-containing protein 2